MLYEKKGAGLIHKCLLCQNILSLWLLLCLGDVYAFSMTAGIYPSNFDVHYMVQKLNLTMEF